MSSKTQAEHRAKLTRNHELYDPCFKEHNQSLQCLWKHQDDKKMCDPFFINYKRCIKFWDQLQRDRRSKGIEPALPSLEEREKIKRDYLDRKFNRK